MNECQKILFITFTTLLIFFSHFFFLIFLTTMPGRNAKPWPYHGPNWYTKYKRAYPAWKKRYGEQERWKFEIRARTPKAMMTALKNIRRQSRRPDNALLPRIFGVKTYGGTYLEGTMRLPLPQTKVRAIATLMLITGVNRDATISVYPITDFRVFY